MPSLVANSPWDLKNLLAAAKKSHGDNLMAPDALPIYTTNAARASTREGEGVADLRKLLATWRSALCNRQRKKVLVKRGFSCGTGRMED
jgi:hypothetical protein